VPLKTYDESFSAVRRGLESAKLPGSDKSQALKRLDRFVRVVEGANRDQISTLSCPTSDHVSDAARKDSLRRSRTETCSVGEMLQFIVTLPVPAGTESVTTENSVRKR
jgi:hypothetical protein